MCIIVSTLCKWFAQELYHKMYCILCLNGSHFRAKDTWQPLKNSDSMGDIKMLKYSKTKNTTFMARIQVLQVLLNW